MRDPKSTQASLERYASVSRKRLLCSGTSKRNEKNQGGRLGCATGAGGQKTSPKTFFARQGTCGPLETSADSHHRCVVRGIPGELVSTAAVFIGIEGEGGGEGVPGQ